VKKGDLVRHVLDTENRTVGVIVRIDNEWVLNRPVVLIQWSVSPKCFNKNIDGGGPHWHWLEDLRRQDESR